PEPRGASPWGECPAAPGRPPPACVGLAWASAASGDLLPKTVAMPLPIFSRAMLAVLMAPTLQPVRVNGTHGAGAILPSAPAIRGGGVARVGSDNGSVQ